MPELKLLSEREPFNPLSDWIIRVGVAAFYFVFGLEKFSGAELHWIKLFQEIGIGEWFRYFTGAVEMIGALLVLIPEAALVGFTLLSVTMAAAASILLLVLHRPADSVFPAIFLLVLAGLAWNRRRRRSPKTL